MFQFEMPPLTPPTQEKPDDIHGATNVEFEGENVRIKEMKSGKLLQEREREKDPLDELLGKLTPFERGIVMRVAKEKVKEDEKNPIRRGMSPTEDTQKSSELMRQSQEEEANRLLDERKAKEQFKEAA